MLVPLLAYKHGMWSFVGCFVNRVLRRIFGPKRDEAAGEWRKLHDEGIHILYSSPNIIPSIHPSNDATAQIRP
jgi:hypothetical protein